jgi:hypothetical protein
MFPDDEDPYEAPRGRWRGAVVAAIVLLTLAAAGAAAYYLAVGKDPATNSAIATRSPSPSPSATPSPTPAPELAAEVEVDFADVAFGERVQLSVLEQQRDDRCRTHAFKPVGAFPDHVGVFLSDCTDWEDGGFELYFFYVEVINHTDDPVTLRRANFLLLDRKGKRHRPVDVRTQAEDPRDFLAGSARISANGELRGFLAFDAKPAYVPRSITYRDGEQQLTVRFASGHRVLDRTG